MNPLPGLHAAIRSGANLCGFLSGGGLRVVSLSKHPVKAYGEHPDVVEALRIAEEDLAAGGRPYGKVYGEDGVETHYLTGSRTPSCPFDAWVRKGNPFDIAFDGEFVAVLSSYGHTEIPEDVTALARIGERVEWSNRGFKYITTSVRFEDGKIGTSTEVVGGDEKARDAWMYRITKTGRGSDIWTAINVALGAAEVE